MTKLKNISKKEFEDLYVKKEKSSNEISKMFNVDSCTILRKLKKYNIKVRTYSQSGLIKSEIPSKDELFRLYITNLKGVKKTASILGLRMSSCYKWLKHYNIPIRTTGESNKLKEKKIDKYKEEIISLYNEGLTMREIARKFNFDVSTISYLFKRENIEIRKNGAYERKISKRKRMISKKVIQKYLNGESTPILAKEFNCCVCSICNILQRGNIKRRGSKGLSPVNKLKLPKEELEDLYVNKKIPTNKIADIYNTKHTVICNRLREWGIKLKDPKEALKEANERKRKVFVKDYPLIIKLYNQGQSTMEIGKLFNVSDSRISEVLKKFNIEIRYSIYGYNKKLVTIDGIKVDSSGEMIISNWLFKKGIHYKYDKKLPNTNYRYDFKIKINGEIIYVEYWGMQGISFYDEKTEKKLAFYKQNNLNLISIYPNDNITKVLDKNLLNKQLIPMAQ